MKREAVPPCVAGIPTGMTDAILCEIAERLRALAENGEEATIDLRSLPMSEGDRDALEIRLGYGEAAATIDVAGLTEVWETTYSGLWWIRHMGTDNRITHEEIAITTMPEVLKAHSDDVREAARKLRLELDGGGRGPREEEALHV